MSIVAVHGPTTFGSQAITEVGPAMATVDATNGLIWTFKLDAPSTRTASLVWTFPTGTPATATGPGPHVVTFASAGTKAVTAVATGVGEGANPYPPAGTTNIPVTAVSGQSPRMVEGDDEGEPEPELQQQSETPPEEVSPPEEDPRAEDYDPDNFTVDEVKEHAEVLETAEEVQTLIDKERAGKDRSTLITYLESMLPYDPEAHTIPEVVQYATDNPDEVAAIIDAEKAGKNRTTLLSQLEAL